MALWSYSEDIGMKFGIDKCAVLELETGRLVRSEGIELPDGERIIELDQERYKYLWVLQLDKSMDKEKKENIGNEYIGREKLKKIGQKSNFRTEVERRRERAHKCGGLHNN